MIPISEWLEEVTQKNHPLYHPFQMTLFGSFAYIGAASFTRNNPRHMAELFTMAYVISQLTAPLFSEWLEPYMDVSLVPLAGQVIQISISFIMANVISRLAGRKFSFRGLPYQIFFFILSLMIAQYGLQKFRQIAAEAS